MSENSYKIYENQATVRSIGSVRFNIVEHTCEVKHMNQNRKGNQDFGQKGNWFTGLDVSWFLIDNFSSSTMINITKLRFKIK